MEPLFPELSCEISGCDGTMTKVSDTEAVCTRDDRHRRKLTLEPKKQSVGAAPTGNPEHLR
jgi:hypothetical protein